MINLKWQIASAASDIACFESSPGKASLTAVWISYAVKVVPPSLLLRLHSPSFIFPYTSISAEFIVLIAFLETSTCGWSYFTILNSESLKFCSYRKSPLEYFFYAFLAFYTAIGVLPSVCWTCLLEIIFLFVMKFLTAGILYIFLKNLLLI